ncbi:MAG: magnesium/cobalt efflux protein [Rickettsiales bacterium]|nr:magnesium/cobalt efflux protein [Rickettsiales bacterium]
MNIIKKIVQFFSKEKKDNYREVIEDLIDQQDISDKKIDDGTKKIFSNVIDIHNKCVEDVMVPRANIIAISELSSLSDLSALMSNSKHSRVPVFNENLDNITGMTHIRDLLNFTQNNGKIQNQEKNAKQISRKILYTVHSMKILDLLLKMRSEKIHMAIVVDEYGGTDGLVTIEDLVEEIVGEIEDEHDLVQQEFFKKTAKGNFEVSARMPIEEFEKKVGKFVKNYEKDKIDTVGGLVFSIAERVPERGEVIVHSSGFEFNVLEADTIRIKKLMVHIK